MRFFLTGFVAMCFCHLVIAAEPRRTWTSKQGKSFSGNLIWYDGKHVFVRSAKAKEFKIDAAWNMFPSKPMNWLRIGARPLVIISSMAMRAEASSNTSLNREEQFSLKQKLVLPYLKSASSSSRIIAYPAS